MIKRAKLQPALAAGMILLGGASLAACGKQAGSDAPVNGDFELRATAPQDQFGRTFGEASRAKPNSEPVNVADGDHVPVSQTAEPLVLD